MEAEFYMVHKNITAYLYMIGFRMVWKLPTFGFFGFWGEQGLWQDLSVVFSHYAGKESDRES